MSEFADDTFEPESVNDSHDAESVNDSHDAESVNDSHDAESGFSGLGLREDVVEAVSDLGYEEPTPIQLKAIPQLLLGVDLLGQAATGTGKTAAFALPILNELETEAKKPLPKALIVVPTRELAVQVSEAIFQYGRKRRVKVVPVFGGQPIGRQFKALDQGAHVVVATPGRAIDHIKRGSLKLHQIETVVLDEADEMLDMGFAEDIEAILEATPDTRQTVMFSATLPKRIERIAKKYQTDPVRIQIGSDKEKQDAQSLISQRVYFVTRNHKASALGRILDIESPRSTIVFCRTRIEVDELTVTMNGRGYRAEALHGGMDQMQRDRVMARLRDGSAELLVATDVAARGLDVDTLTHVVNYDVPSAAESYVHRIGRVGRAGREGTAITLAEPKQRRLLGNIERLTKLTITVAKVPSVADLRAKQVEVTVAAVRDALSSDDLQDYNEILDGLAGEGTATEVALAAIKLVHATSGADTDEREIPDASEFGGKGGKSKGAKSKGGKWKDGKSKDGKPNKGKKGKGKKAKFDDADTGFVFLSVGRKSGLRPADLVGAVANESGLTGRDIGPIKISDNYSVVGVPEHSVNDVVDAMANTKVRGKRAKVRRYKD